MNIIEREKSNTEYHIPGYNYCGPGTKVFTRLTRGDEGINELDAACKCHDIAYMMHAGDDEKLKNADRILREIAQDIGDFPALLVDEIFLMKDILENIGLISPSNFAQKLGHGLSIPDQRKLGKLLYEKYILKNKNISLEEYY